MTVKQLKAWVDSIEDKDRKVPPEVVLTILDRQLMVRLESLLIWLFLYTDEPIQSEALALLIRLQIPE